jgi:hypothetical protein
MADIYRSKGTTVPVNPSEDGVSVSQRSTRQSTGPTVQFTGVRGSVLQSLKDIREKNAKEKRKEQPLSWAQLSADLLAASERRAEIVANLKSRRSDPGAAELRDDPGTAELRDERHTAEA